MDVNALVEQYHTANPFELADYMNIPYFYVNLPEGLKGRMIIGVDETPTILLNANLRDIKFRYTVMAHELYHAFEHSDYIGVYSLMYGGKGKLEHEADLFASKLMTIFYREQYGELPETYYNVCTTYGVKEEFEEYVKVSDEAFCWE